MSNLKKYISLTILTFCFTFTLFSFSDNGQVPSNRLSPSCAECFSDSNYSKTGVQPVSSRYDTKYSGKNSYNSGTIVPSSNAPMTTFNSYNEQIPVGISTSSTGERYTTTPTSLSASPQLHAENQFSSNTTSQPTIISSATESVSVATFYIPNSSEGPLIISP